MSTLKVPIYEFEKISSFLFTVNKNTHITLTLKKFVRYIKKLICHLDFPSPYRISNSKTSNDTMGKYYTCNVCGATAKGVWPCDCPRKTTLKNMKARVGCKIIRACHGFDGINEYLFEKLRTRHGKTLYHATCLGGGGGEI